jgi:hypothetical protein
MPRVETISGWEGMTDGKNLRRKDLLTSFRTDPLKSTSLAIQDSDALKHGLSATPQRRDNERAWFLE